MAAPRDWQPPDDDPPAREFRRRGHQWRWDEQPSTMPKAEQLIRFGIWAMLVITFIALGIKVLIG